MQKILLSRRHFLLASAATGLAGTAAPCAPGHGISAFASATEMAAAIADKRSTSVELCQSFLDRIGKMNSLLNAIVNLRPEAEILFDAAQADKEIAAGHRRSPLHGVPFTLKVVFEAQNTRSTTGNALVDYISPADSDIAAKLRESGAILLGKSNMGDPLGGGTQVTPTAQNPYNIAYHTGGSSSGAAAAVAAGLTAFDIGSDAAGSVRLPASGVASTASKRPREPYRVPVTFGRSRPIGRVSCVICPPMVPSPAASAIFAPSFRLSPARLLGGRTSLRSRPRVDQSFASWSCSNWSGIRPANRSSVMPSLLW